jgi:hypothetical protein
MQATALLEYKESEDKAPEASWTLAVELCAIFTLDWVNSKYGPDRQWGAIRWDDAPPATRRVAISCLTLSRLNPCDVVFYIFISFEMH